MYNSNKDLGKMKNCIGINIGRNQEAYMIMLEQEKCINLVLDCFNIV